MFLTAVKKPQESVRNGRRKSENERARKREREKREKMGDEVFEANVNLGCMQQTIQPHFIRRLLPRISSNRTGDSLRNEDIYTRAQIGSRWALLVITHRSLHFSFGRPLSLSSLLSILALRAHLSRFHIIQILFFFFLRRKGNIFRNTFTNNRKDNEFWKRVRFV